MKNWWKILGVLLVVYVYVGGLTTPLTPGLMKAKVMLQDSLTTSVKITAYNTHFTSNSNTYFITDDEGSQKLNAQSAEVVDDETVILTFDNVEMSSAARALFIANDTDGRMSMVNAFQVFDAPTKNQLLSPLEEVTEQRKSFGFPFREMLFETIRNLLFHVPMWFSMMFLMGISLFYSIKFLNKEDIYADAKASSAAKIAMFFAVLGLVTGSIWARFTWGAWWVLNDNKLNGAAITFLIYAAYFVLRAATEDPLKRARLAGVYNIFAFVMMLVFIMVLPRVTDTLHPGNGGNPAFSQYDLDSSLRVFFYPAVIGWIIIGVWMYQLKNKKEIKELEIYNEA